MRKLNTFLALAALTLLAGCGNESTIVSDMPTGDGTTDPMTPPLPEVASIQVLTSSPQIPSDGSMPATITALLRDAGNNFIAGQSVSFSTTSGGLSIPVDPDGATSTTTDGDGRTSATLSTAGDPTNRIIAITATSGDLSSTVQVQVTGTQLTISGPDNLVQGAQADYTIVLADAGGNGIANQTINLSSSLANVLAATTLTTDFSGQAQVRYTAINGGTDSFEASALGETIASTIQVSADTFNFSAPAEGAEINLGAIANVSVTWVQNNAPVVGQTVVFSTTRGSVSPASVVTDANGVASTTVTAQNSGPGVITATALNGPVASRAIEFLAVTPDSIEVQADPFTVAPNSQSTITAVLRDPAGNLVKNKRVTFSLEDITGGTLSVSSAVTDSQGRAQTFYTSSATTSAADGVIVTAVVDENTSIRDSVNLTVAGREVFFVFGTGNTISEPNDAQYLRNYAVQVTDADGRPVQNVEVAMSVVSVRYVKGFYWPNTTDDVWSSFSRVRCDDEDINRNGILDPGEDFNNTGQIEAGNVATISPGTFTTDELGEGQVVIRYPQQFGGWLEVELQARASVQGTEFSERASFILGVLADDVNDLEQAPPGVRLFVNDFNSSDVPGDVTTAIGVQGSTVEFFSSPFGYNNNCSVWEFSD
ncbi:MAG: Ig-like domain-containing protein [Pseudomonadota bacterium]